MDSKQLSYFRIVYEKKSFSKAAEAAFISSQGINKAVHQLENELGVPLFEPGENGLIPTTYGELLYLNSENYLKVHRRTLHEIEEMKLRNRKSLIIRMAQGQCDNLPSHFFVNFMKENPEIRVFFHSYPDNECNQVLQQVYDSVGMCASTDPFEGYTTVYEYKSRIFLIVGEGHPFAKRKTIRFEELKNENLINHKFDSTQAKQNGAMAKLRIDPQNILTVADRNLTMDLIASGYAVSFHAAEFYKSFPGIVRVDFEDMDMEFTSRIMVADAIADTPAAKSFTAYVKRTLGQGNKPWAEIQTGSAGRQNI